jgi:hypothetical protein
MNNTLDENRLMSIRLFLKNMDIPELRIKMKNIIPEKYESMIGKLEVVSDGKDIWLEQNGVFLDTKDYKVKDKTHKSGYRMVYGVPKLYVFIPRIVDEFFKKYASIILKENKKS